MVDVRHPSMKWSEQVADRPHCALRSTMKSILEGYQVHFFKEWRKWPIERDVLVDYVGTVTIG